MSTEIKTYTLSHLIHENGLNHPEVIFWVSVWQRRIMDEVDYRLQRRIQDVVKHPYSPLSNTVEGRISLITNIAQSLVETHLIMDNLAKTLGLPVHDLVAEIRKSKIERREPNLFKVIRNASEQKDTV